eukprot:3682821-Amphidinium_carterae.1
MGASSRGSKHVVTRRSLPCNHARERSHGSDAGHAERAWAPLLEYPEEGGQTAAGQAEAAGP